MNELCQVWPGTAAPFDMIRQDCVCVCLCVCVQLLHLPSHTHELGHQTQHAWHFKEEAICWKQATHLDYLDPRIELCPESLPISLKPGLVHSSVALMSPKVNVRASGACKLRRPGSFLCQF